MTTTISEITDFGSYVSFCMEGGLIQNVPKEEWHPFFDTIKVGDKVEWQCGRNRYYTRPFWPAQ